jgi:hypothetical protein
VTYTVTFKESGLVPGTSWSAGVDHQNASSTTNKIGFQVPNGSYAYTLGVVPGYARAGMGSLTVAGSNLTVQVTFIPSVYKVTFAEKGLMPHGTSWSVTLNGVTESSTTRKIQFTEDNGTFAYTVGAIAGWHLTSGVYTGTVMVAGGPVKVHEKFAKTTYKLSFTETGLVGGSSWQVRVDGQTIVSTTSRIVVWVANGTYTFHVSGPAGTTPTPGTGSATISGSSATKSIVFS